MKELSQIVQESVSKYNEQYVLFKFAGQVLDEPQIFPSVKPTEIENHLISSQISLLEAELLRKKGMFKELISYESDERGWNELIRNDIIYFTEQIEECRKLLK